MAHKYFDPFAPEAFEKKFIKRNNKQNDGREELIDNSLEGLSQYFTAPNIRNKVTNQPLNTSITHNHRSSTLSSWL